ncbi:heterokaryon incompatibility protein-domain-containing protein [Phyllosticta capitalensis]
MAPQVAANLQSHLCDLCKGFVRRNNGFQFRTDPASTASADDLFYDCTVEHYPSIEALVRGAEEEACHLCSVLLGWILKNGDGVLQEARDRSKSSAKTRLPLTSWVSGIAQPMVSDSSEDKGWIKLELRLYQNFVEAGEDSRECLAWTQLCHKPEAQPDGGQKISDTKQSQLEAYTGSDAVFQMIEMWLNKCRSSHPDCKPASQDRKPTRLLDLQIDETRDIRVVSGAQVNEEAPFASLSYCWGLVPQTKLTTKNFNDFSLRIPFNSISKTMQDAVTVCRGLSVRYLWIDALCIIQGPDGDFQQEASRMMSVYAGSLFTICAADSTDSAGGCLFTRNPLRQLNCKVGLSNRQNTYIQAFYPCKRKSTVPGASPLNSRGWVFQESLLSPRSLYFSRSGIHWECRGGVACEHSPDFNAHHGESIPLKRNFADLHSPPSTSKVTSTNSDAFAGLWNSIVEGYSVTSLSFNQDRLIAMAGIATSIQKRFEASGTISASFGLWLPTFLDQLLWCNSATFQNASAPRPSSLAIAPSWSWVNIGGSQEVTSLLTTMSPFDDSEEAYELLELRSAKLIRLPPATGFADTLPRPSELLTRKYAILLKGQLVQCRYWQKTNPAPRHWNMPGHLVITKHCLDPIENVPTGCGGARVNFGDEFFLPDCEIAPSGSDDVEMPLYCVLLKRQYFKKGGDNDGTVEQIFDCGLVVTPIEDVTLQGGSHVVYRRVGTYSGTPGQ